VDECADKGSRRKEGQDYAGQIVVYTHNDSGNCQQATDRQEDKHYFSVVRG
jgi:hypothetical protein